MDVFEKYKKYTEVRAYRRKRFEDWLNINDFDKLLYKLILIHDNDYITSSYSNGKFPKPNNILGFIIDYVIDLGGIKVNRKELEFKSKNEIYKFKNYYFQVIFERNPRIRIYNKDDMKKLLELYF